MSLAVSVVSLGKSSSLDDTGNATAHDQFVGRIVVLEPESVLTQLNGFQGRQV